MRREIESAVGIDAVDIYGLSEVMGPGVAQEYAATKDGPTIWEDHFYPEIVDPESGEPVADGEHGELVFTSLTKEAMPVIRYRTRDLTRLLPGTNGPMRRMAKITGRSDDMLIIRGVNLFPSQIEEQILRCERLAPHYRIDLTRPARMDIVTVHVESKPGCTQEDAGSAARELRQHIKNIIGVSVEVKVCQADSLERSAGKACRVRDLRNVP
jgi:phenylacetate-CoA ligase